MKHLSTQEILNIYDGIRLQKPSKFSRYGCLKITERLLFYFIILFVAIFTISGIVGLFKGRGFFSFLFSYMPVIYMVVIWFIFKWQLKTRKEAAGNYSDDEQNLILYFEPEIKQIQAQVEMQRVQRRNTSNAQISKGFGTAGKMIGGLAGGTIGAVGGIASTGLSGLNTGATQLMNYISLKKAKRAITDEQYDSIVNTLVTNDLMLKERGLEGLNIDEESLSELPPICVKNYWINEREDYPLCAIGQDGIYRTSTHQITWLFFTSKQIGVFDHYTELFNRGMVEDMKEFYWKDVVSITTKIETSKVGIEQKTLLIKDASGDSFSCSYNNDLEIERAIKGLKSYFRDVKERNS